ncbi:MAG: CvpA family protein [Alphaproteobacteria bacterium]
MSETPLTVTDAFILALVLASAFLALLRGCVRESLAVAAWVLSAFITYSIYYAGGPALTQLFSGNWFVHTILVLGIFAGLVSLFTIANQKILERIGTGDKVPTWDQVAGFCFGFLRGLALVAILFQVHVLVFGAKETPSWFREARLFPIVAGTANILKVALPGPINKASAAQQSSTRTPARPARAPKTGDPVGERPDGAGYSKDERTAIDRLVRNKLDKQ